MPSADQKPENCKRTSQKEERNERWKKMERLRRAERWQDRKMRRKKKIRAKKETKWSNRKMYVRPSSSGLHFCFASPVFNLCCCTRNHSKFFLATKPTPTLGHFCHSLRWNHRYQPVPSPWQREAPVKKKRPFQATWKSMGSHPQLRKAVRRGTERNPLGPRWLSPAVFRAD